MSERPRGVFCTLSCMLVFGLAGFGVPLSAQTVLKRKAQAFQLKGVQPLPGLKKTITFTPGTMTCVPPLVRGDRDFAGNGPAVSCKVSITPTVNKDKLVCTVWMSASETVNYRETQVTGKVDKIIYDAPAGWTISRVLSPTESSKSYTDNDHEDDVYAMGNFGLVKVFQFVGDTQGDEAGSKTGVTVTFNPVKIEILNTVIHARTQSIVISPGARTFVPPHRRGDKDFGGHGPFVSCEVDLELHSQNNELICRIAMLARETRSDWTTARGNERFTIYRAPAGKRITKIEEGYHSKKEYTDTDHGDDSFAVSIGPVQKFIFTGDTSGEESGTRTKVVVIFKALHIHLADKN